VSRETQIADALVTELNHAARPWNIPSSAFTATRGWHTVYTATTLRTLQVRVVPLDLEEEQVRDLTDMTYSMAIDFQQAVDPDSNTAIDALAGIVEQVGDYYRTPHSLIAGWTATGCKLVDSQLFNLLHRERHWEAALIVRVRGAVL
jgi:hypothetical protein